MDQIKKALFELTGLEHIVLTDRCNTAINLAYRIARKTSKTKCFLIDPLGGGWHEHLHAAKRHGFDITVLKTTYLFLNPSLLDAVDDKSIVIIPSLSEYCYLHPIREFSELCRARGALLINDCCGSVTVPNLLVGDLLVCSFGSLKAINNHAGGFLSIRRKELRALCHADDYKNLDESRLLSKIADARNRVINLNNASLRIMDVLQKNGKRYVNNSEILNFLVMAHYESVDERGHIIELAESVQDIYYQYPNKPQGLITLSPESTANLIEAGTTRIGRRVLTDQQEKRRQKVLANSQR